MLVTRVASEVCVDGVLFDRTDPVSDLSPNKLLSSDGEVRFAEDALGLSADRGTEPGILDLMELRKERDDSFVSDRENDGYLSKPGPSSPEEPLFFSPFDG